MYEKYLNIILFHQINVSKNEIPSEDTFCIQNMVIMKKITLFVIFSKFKLLYNRNKSTITFYLEYNSVIIIFVHEMMIIIIHII